MLRGGCPRREAATIIARSTAIAAAGLVAVAGLATALTLDVIHISDKWDCQVVPGEVVKTFESFDLTVTPGAKVLLAGDATGKARLLGLWGAMRIRTEGPLGGESFSIGTAGSPPCHGVVGNYDPTDITFLFKPGPNTVTITYFTFRSGQTGLYHFQMPDAYLVATGGHMVSLNR